MLDEIVCLGSNSPNDRANQHRVTGVVLHVEKSAETAAFSLVFRREITSVIQIGRRSGHESDKGHNAPLTSAMFRCAVVSRKHAKIVFSDSGHAYIVDSGSHHGTHLRKLGDSFPRMLKPEISTLLNDGDIVTFGKAVGKGDDWVKPVVAVVQLLFAPTSFKALTVPSPSSSEKSRCSSGRYGLHDSSSDDAEDAYSSSSDIEEITPPESSPVKVTSVREDQQGTPATSQTKPLEQSHDSPQVTATYSAFKRLISPAIKRLPSVSEIIGDKGVGLFDGAGKSLLNFPTFPSPIWKQDDANFDARRRHILDSRLPSRCSSPMDLGSPAEPQPPVSRRLSTPLLTPLIDPPGAALAPLFDLPPVSMGTSAGVGEPTSSSPVSAPHESHPENVVECLPAPVPTPPSDGTTENASEVAEIQLTLKELRTSVDKLQGSRRKYRSRFNANVSFMSNKLSEINDKFAEVDAEYNILCDQVEDLQHGDLPDLARQIEDLNERVDAIMADRDDDKFDMPQAQLPASMPLEDAKISVDSLNDLANEMRALLVKSQEDFSHQLNDMKVAREEAMKTIEEAKAMVALASAVQTPVPTSLKRKRDDMDEDEDAAVGLGQAESACVVSADDPDTGAAIEEAAVEMNQGDSTADTAKDIDTSVDVIEPPPRKKIRTVGSVIAHTATAVTIGAVVTWSALAFS